MFTERAHSIYSYSSFYQQKCRHFVYFVAKHASIHVFAIFHGIGLVCTYVHLMLVRDEHVTVHFLRTSFDSVDLILTNSHVLKH